MSSRKLPALPVPKRIDLHCHSNASGETTDRLRNAINCPESYSEPYEVYQQARRRGMDFVTITDHDSLEGVMRIIHEPEVFIGEELSCYFPEDRCKIHLLLWGISRQDHDALRLIADDLYKVAAYVARHQLAHAVAHPLYRQNDILEAYHLQRLLLLFKGFECINGAHSALHRQSLVEVLDGLGALDIENLSQKHGLGALWPQPWIKSRTGGSDDHGLLNIGRTWTEVPATASTVEQVLQCLKEGRCRPGGASGSGLKLAHAIYSVGVRYVGRDIESPQSPSLPTMLLQALVGDRPVPTERQMIKLALKHKLKGWKTKLLKPWKRKHASSAGKILGKGFLESAKARLPEHEALVEAIKEGAAPLARHAEMFRFASDVNRDVAETIARAIENAAQDHRFIGFFDAVAAAMAHQFLLLPYYFAFFHQNKERDLLDSITGRSRLRDPNAVRIGVFTDTIDEVNGVSRFLRDMGEQAYRKGRTFMIHSCSRELKYDLPFRKNFQPLLSRSLPYYPELQLNLPPVLEIMEWADRQQFDVIEVSTPGTMGLMGMLVGKMLKVPIVATYHTDFPAFVKSITGDAKLAAMTKSYMRWFYSRLAKVFSRTRQYFPNLRELGVPQARLVATTLGIDTAKFNPRHRDLNAWTEYGVKENYRLLNCGRISLEKNLPLLVQAFKKLCQKRRDTALIIAGDGPYKKQMQRELEGLPAYFLGYMGDQELGRLYASSDMYIFPSLTDTLGQVVLEAQASSLPVLVSDVGGPKEAMDDGITGLVLPGTDPEPWARAMNNLLTDEPRRLRMGRTGVTRISRFSIERAFEHLWAEHVQVVMPNHVTKLAEEETPAQAENQALSQAVVNG